MAVDWGSLLREWGPTALQVVSGIMDRNAGRDATDAQQDALDRAGQLQYQTALQAMELARLRDIQTRLDTRPSRFQGFNAMQVIARQLGLPVYQGRFDETLGAFAPGSGGVGTGGGSVNGTPFTPSFVATNRSANRMRDAGATGSQVGSIAGSIVGGYFGGPAGAAAGSYLGDKYGKGLGREIYRRGTVVGPVTAGLKALPGLAANFINKFIGDGGDLATGSRVYANSNGVFFDQDGNVIARVRKPETGMVRVPGLSRNGNPIFLTSEGKIVKQQQSGGGFDDLNFSLSSATDGPAEVNGVIARGYNPLPATAADYGVDPNEAAGSEFIGETIGPDTALGRYAGFEETPGYQFVMDEGLRARDRVASSRGRYFSGGTARELQRYAQGLASQEYDNYFRRLQDQVTGGNSATSLAVGQGANATNSAINSLTGGANSLGEYLSAGGAVRASGIAANNTANNRIIEGVAGSGIFDRLGTIFGGSTKTTGTTTAGRRQDQRSPIPGTAVA